MLYVREYYLMAIIQATGDARPLELMAQELGYRLAPMN